MQNYGWFTGTRGKVNLPITLSSLFSGTAKAPNYQDSLNLVLQDLTTNTSQSLYSLKNWTTSGTFTKDIQFSTTLGGQLPSFDPGRVRAVGLHLWDRIHVQCVQPDDVHPGTFHLRPDGHGSPLPGVCRPRQWTKIGGLPVSLVSFSRLTQHQRFPRKRGEESPLRPYGGSAGFQPV